MSLFHDTSFITTPIEELLHKKVSSVDIKYNEQTFKQFLSFKSLEGTPYSAITQGFIDVTYLITYELLTKLFLNKEKFSKQYLSFQKDTFYHTITEKLELMT
jgi:hypothetical protein